MNDDLEHAMNVLHINREGVSRLVYMPRHEKTCLQWLVANKVQTCLTEP